MELKAKDRKITPNGARVIVYRDPRNNWYVGRLVGGRRFDPPPTGIFASWAESKQWADTHYPGGCWEPLW
jgi:hypothetical protein